jgi:hypothetical protein
MRRSQQRRGTCMRLDEAAVAVVYDADDVSN